MSLETKQATTDGTTDDGWDLTTELKVICTLWLLSAILAGVLFVALSDVFAGLA
jgi:hypothetical protein